MSRLLGLSWNTWVRIAIVSWILLFAAAWVSLTIAWMSDSDGADIFIGGSFIAVILAHAVPGDRGPGLAERPGASSPRARGGRALVDDARGDRRHRVLHRRNRNT